MDPDRHLEGMDPKPLRSCYLGGFVATTDGPDVDFWLDFWEGGTTTICLDIQFSQAGPRYYASFDTSDFSAFPAQVLWLIKGICPGTVSGTEEHDGELSVYLSCEIGYRLPLGYDPQDRPEVGDLILLVKNPVDHRVDVSRWRYHPDGACTAYRGFSLPPEALIGADATAAMGM